MNGGKTLAVVLIILAIAGMYLHSGKQLTPLYDALKNPSNGGSGQTLGKLGVAIALYVLIISFVPDDDAVWITGLVILGALLANHQMQGNNDLITKLAGYVK